MTEESKRKKRQSSLAMIEKEIRLLGVAGNSEDEAHDHRVGKDRGIFSGASSCRGKAGNPSMERRRQALPFSSCRREVMRIISLVRLTFPICYGLNFCVPSEFQR